MCKEPLLIEYRPSNYLFLFSNEGTHMLGSLPRQKSSQLRTHEILSESSNSQVNPKSLIMFIENASGMKSPHLKFFSKFAMHF